LESDDTNDQAVQKLEQEVHTLDFQAGFFVVSITIKHSVIIVNIFVLLLLFVVTPDLSESIDLQSSMHLEDW